jgi:hypothetical protein
MKSKAWFWILITTLIAVALAGTAAYFSVFGLSKLFAGAGLSALILFGAIEIGKLVGVSVLYRFWKIFSLPIKSFFTLMIIGIMIITSLGIYGFLRNAYDQTSNEYSVIQKETTIKEQRKSAIQLEIDRYQQEIDSKNNQISTYMSNRSTQEQLVADLYGKSADTNMTSNQSWVYRTRAKETQDAIKESDSQIDELRSQNNIIYSKISQLNDSISNIDRQILELESNDISVEIGPFKYLSDLTGVSMDNVVGILIFLIMFVFDPFAILLIIVANRLSMLDGKKINEEQEPEVIKKGMKLLKKFRKKSDEEVENINNDEFNDENTEVIENEEYIEDTEKKTQLVKESSNNVQVFDLMYELNNLKEKINEISSKDNSEITNELKKIKEKMDEISSKDISKEIDSLKKKIDDVTSIDEDSKIIEEFKKLKNKIDSFSINDISEKMKDDIRDEFKEYVDGIVDKISGKNDKDEITRMVKNIKKEFDERLASINDQIKKNETKEVTVIPGRYIHGRGFRAEKRE